MVVGEFSPPSVLEQMSSALSLPSVLPKAPGMRACAELTKGGSPASFDVCNAMTQVSIEFDACM